MGKASKWLRNIFGLKRTDASSKPPHKDKRRWSFVKSYREKRSSAAPAAVSNNSCSSNSYANSSSMCVNHQQQKEYVEVVDPNEHVIAAAAAEAAIAVARLTSDGAMCACEPVDKLSSSGSHREIAAVMIQSAFRGYLVRRALRALKGLVRLQALVRGHIERKRTAEWLRRMQAIFRAQARARAERTRITESSQSSAKSSHFHHPGTPTPEKSEHASRSKSQNYGQPSMLKRNGSKSSGRALDNQKMLYLGRNRSDLRIYEQIQDHGLHHSTRTGPIDDEIHDVVDSLEPHFTIEGRNLFHSSHLALHSDLCNSRDTHRTYPSPSSGEVQSQRIPLKFDHVVEEFRFCNADYSPQFYSALSQGGTSKRSPFTPAKSDGSRSYQSGYSDDPNYMAYTQSSKAKVRSLSAPKQRPHYERSNSTKRHSIHDFIEPKSNTQKAYSGSGRLAGLGMPFDYIY
ncbi:IQ-domain 22 [Hibiscus trionum]|uniref:IQ-domain 22 n=1 Tax=Hibiscus trionum TaxID=183268 RepID=A0A9W7H655_HIBTR|nr:IQ-domain 22 [Hibiscus trionum]